MSWNKRKVDDATLADDDANDAALAEMPKVHMPKVYNRVKPQVVLVFKNGEEVQHYWCDILNTECEVLTTALSQHDFEHGAQPLHIPFESSSIDI